MSPLKSTSAKKKSVVKNKNNDEEVDPPKVKKIIEMEESEISGVIVDEKAPDDAFISDDSEELEVEEVGMDDEDLNPFGDKWEQ